VNQLQIDAVVAGIARPIAALSAGVMTLAAAWTDNAVDVVQLPAGLAVVYGAFALYRRAGRTLREENEALSEQLAVSRQREELLQATLDRQRAQCQEEIDRLRSRTYALALEVMRLGGNPGG